MVNPRWCKGNPTEIHTSSQYSATKPVSFLSHHPLVPLLNWNSSRTALKFTSLAFFLIIIAFVDNGARIICYRGMSWSRNFLNYTSFFAQEENFILPAFAFCCHHHRRRPKNMSIVGHSRYIWNRHNIFLTIILHSWIARAVSPSQPGRYRI